MLFNTVALSNGQILVDGGGLKPEPGADTGFLPGKDSVCLEWRRSVPGVGARPSAIAHPPGSAPGNCDVIRD